MPKGIPKVKKTKLAKPEVTRGQERHLWENSVAQIKKVIKPGTERDYHLRLDVYGVVNGQPKKISERILDPATQRAIEHNFDIIAMCDADIASYVRRECLEVAAKLKEEKQAKKVG